MRSPSSLSEVDDVGRTLSGSSAYFDMDNTLRRDASTCMISALCEALSPGPRDAPRESIGGSQATDDTEEGVQVLHTTTVVRLATSMYAASVTSYAPDAFSEVQKKLDVSPEEVCNALWLVISGCGHLGSTLSMLLVFAVRSLDRSSALGGTALPTQGF
jgi:hypothetical protein